MTVRKRARDRRGESDTARQTGREKDTKRERQKYRDRSKETDTDRETGRAR